MVHDGKFFTVGHFINNVGDDASLDLLIQVSATRSMHATFGVQVGGDCEAYFYEGTTFSGAGTAITIYNNNRFSSTVATATITHTPTVSGVGTQIVPTIWIPGGSGGQAIGGQGGGPTRTGTEWILATSGVYLLRVTNRAGQATEISSQVAFYEPN